LSYYLLEMIRTNKEGMGLIKNPSTETKNKEGRES
jgi:hypothetical protein